MDTWHAFGLVLLGFLGGWALFWLRTRVFVTPPPMNEPLDRTATAFGLARGRDGVYRGHIQQVPVEVEPLIATDGTPGLRLTVTATQPLAGEVRLSGPSENAGGGQPEVKIRVGDGLFDYQFWVLTSKPKQAASDLLLPQDRARAAMLGVPFGRWTFAGRSLVYESYRVLPGEFASTLSDVVRVFGDLSHPG
jgi:hypothetical protein